MVDLKSGEGKSFKSVGSLMKDLNEEEKLIKIVKKDRFEQTRGKAQIKWSTDELMNLLRHPK